MEDDRLLERCKQYASTPADDYQRRDTIGLTEAERDALHRRAIQDPTLWPLHHQVRTAQLADLIYLKGGQQCGWSIIRIRAQLNREESRTFTDEGNQVHETTYYRIWPLARYIHRVQTSPEGYITDEVEWAYNYNVDLDADWDKYRPGFEEESLLLAPIIPDIAFLPPAANITYRTLFTAGDRTKTFEFPVALRYEPLLRKFAREYHLEGAEWEANEMVKETLQRHSSVELTEGLHELWVAVQEYDPGTVKHIPGYLKKRVKFHMGDQFDKASTEAEKAMRGPDQSRILKEAFDRLGGELDAPLPSDDEKSGEDTSLYDLVPDASSPQPDETTLLSQVKRALPDPVDRQIFYGLTALDLTQKELAAHLNMTQPAVSQRFEKIREQVRRILKP